MSNAFFLTTACVQKFVDVKCLKAEGNDDSNAESNIDRAEMVLTEWRDRLAECPDDFDVSLLDEDKMMAHILDCYASLCSAQQYRVQNKRPSRLDAKTQQAKNKVFKTAMSLMSTGMTHDGSESPSISHAISKMITTSQWDDITDDRCSNVFPDDLKQTDGRGWMPLHWASIGLDTPEGNVHGLTEDDVHLVYASDPLALQRYHKYNEAGVDGQDQESNCTDIQRYTPTHFLCMQPVTTKRTSLLQFFSICNRQALFIPSVLHVTCQLGQLTEELLKFLLQLDSTQTAKRYGSDKCTPLGLLCSNNSCNTGLMKCLLDVDSSTAVIIDGLFSCIRSSEFDNMLERFDLLSTYHDWNVLEEVDELLLNRLLKAVLTHDPLVPSSLCITFIQRFVTVRPNVVKEVFEDFRPVQTAVRECPLEVMEFLLNLYPEAVMVVIGAESGFWSLFTQYNFLHSAKITYLCSRYPEILYQRNVFGKTPLHVVLDSSFPRTLLCMLFKFVCELGGQELVRMPVVHDGNSNDGWLPLHFFVRSASSNRSLLCTSSPHSEAADFFRMLLRWYPESAGIAAGKPGNLKTPYDLAVDSKLDPYYLRLLLRAVPNLNPADFHRLNDAERRMAMFLAFRAAASDPKPLLMARLRFENIDLVKHVVSFL